MLCKAFLSRGAIHLHCLPLYAGNSTTNDEYRQWLKNSTPSIFRRTDSALRIQRVRLSFPHTYRLTFSANIHSAATANQFTTASANDRVIPVPIHHQHSAM